MSDIPADYIEELKLRDTRFAALGESIAIETDLRDNATIKAIMAAIREDADRAMAEIVEISPADVSSISLQLVKMRTLVYTRGVLSMILARGAAAAQSIQAQDARDADERD